MRTGYAVLPQNACEWYFDGEAPVRAIQGAGLPDIELYKSLAIDGFVSAANLHQSDSEICLAGRITGESASRSIFEQVRFRKDSHCADLPHLLTIHHWSPGTISRVTYFNSRTNELDRNAGLTRLVVADGDGAFLRVLDREEFTSSDVVGVIHRSVERDRLDSIGFKIAELQQWYSPDVSMSKRIPPPPSGIATIFLRRK